MSPITHFFIGWLVAIPTKLTNRERALIAFAGVTPHAHQLKDVKYSKISLF